jgi:hypothetical protein
LQITFEASRDAVVAALPCEVTRTVPCYARVVVLEAESTPAGPLRMAALLAGGRYQMQPRNVLVRGIVSGQAARLSGAFGGGFAAGEAQVKREGGRLGATISNDAGEIARIAFPEMRAVDASMLRWDPWLGVAQVGGGPHLVEWTLEPAIEQAFLTKQASIEIDAGLSDGPLWGQLKSLGVISACYAEGTLVFGERTVAEAIGD